MTRYCPDCKRLVEDRADPDLPPEVQEYRKRDQQRREEARPDDLPDRPDRDDPADRPDHCDRCGAAL